MHSLMGCRYYNSGIVSAAEGSLNQFFNLILAILFKRYPYSYTESARSGI